MTAIADVNGTHLTYLDIGSGIPLLCLHGGMGVDSQSLLVPGILKLATRGIRLVIPDQRGHGKSSRGSLADYTHQTWATDARELVRHLRLSKVALLGHSYGGFLTLEYAVRWPESLTHLVLVATSAGPVRAGTRTFASEAELRQHFRQVWPLFFAGEDKHWPLFDAIDFSQEPYNAAFVRELPAYDLRDRVGGLNVPILLVVGSHDPYRPHMEWLAEQAPKARLCVLDGVGHFPFVEAPDEFVKTVVSFLTDAQSAE
jgi:pimeloyl-ACP methyl ester carboxylesterase